MAQRRRGKNGVVGPVVGFLLVGTIVFAFLKSGDHSPTGVLESATGWSNNVQTWVHSWTDDIHVDFDTPQSGTDAPAEPATPVPGAAAPTDTATVTAQLASLTIADADKSDYNRDEWRHWDNITSCWTVREEVLARQAEPNSVTYLDREKNVTTDKTNACSVTGGTWIDPYTGKTFTNPADLDIDHMIPLGYAALHGGQAWDSDKKKDYANSLIDGHLLAVFASANRQKSDNGPGEWEPQQSYQCQYAKNWVSVSTTWQLSTTQSDKDALTKMLATCA